MRNYKRIRKSMAGLTVMLAGGTLFADGCLNTVASLPICGGLLTFCTPTDQLLLFFPVLEVPDFEADPGCTIPGVCGDAGSFEAPGDFFPGGEPPEEPEDEGDGQGGGFGGGGGGGGGI